MIKIIPKEKLSKKAKLETEPSPAPDLERDESGNAKGR